MGTGRCNQELENPSIPTLKIYGNSVARLFGPPSTASESHNLWVDETPPPFVAKHQHSQAAKRPTLLSKINSWSLALKASLSGILAKISTTSSGREAFMFSTLSPCKVSCLLSNVSLLRIFRLWAMPIRMCFCQFSHTPCTTKEVKGCIHSNHLSKIWIFHAPRAPSYHRTYSSHNGCFSHHIQMRVFVEELRFIALARWMCEPCDRINGSIGFAPQIPACWLTANAQIQYVSARLPCTRSISSRASTPAFSESSSAMNSNVCSPKASDTTLATKSRWRLDQLWVIIFFGRTFSPLLTNWA